MDKSHTVFIIDENKEEYGELIATIEQNSSYSVVFFNQVKSAVKAILEGDTPSLCLVNQQVGEESGNELCRFVKMDEDTRRIVVLMLCPEFSGRKIADAIASGCDDILQKPIDPVFIAERIQLLCRNQ